MNTPPTYSPGHRVTKKDYGTESNAHENIYAIKSDCSPIPSP